MMGHIVLVHPTEADLTAIQKYNDINLIFHIYSI